MNVTEVDSVALLDTLNAEMVELMTPLFVYLSVLMVTGLVGNTMVCIYYGCVSKRTTHSIFIVTLAVFDLLSCGISIPTEIADTALYYTFTSHVACKLLRFNNHFLTISSAFTLLVIAGDRYRRVCQSTKKQLTMKQAKIACILAAGASLVFSWPAFIIYDTELVDIMNDFNVTINGSDCTTVTDEELELTSFALNGTYGVIFVLSTTVLVIMYTCIGREVYLSNKFNQSYSLSFVNSRYGDNLNNLSNNVASFQHNELTAVSYRKRLSSAPRTEPTMSRDTNENNEDTKAPTISNSISIRSKSRDISHVKYTLIMFVITVVFLLSFLPYLSLVIWRSITRNFTSSSPSETVAIDIGMRSFFVNSAINPLIYGLFNPKFRKYFRSVSCQIRENKRASTDTVTSVNFSATSQSRVL